MEGQNNSKENGGRLNIWDKIFNVRMGLFLATFFIGIPSTYYYLYQISTFRSSEYKSKKVNIILDIFRELQYTTINAEKMELEFRLRCQEKGIKLFDEFENTRNYASNGPLDELRMKKLISSADEKGHTIYFFLDHYKTANSNFIENVKISTPTTNQKSSGIVDEITDQTITKAINY